MLTLLIIFYIEQLQSENASEEMLLVEAEFFTLLGFRTVSGNCSEIHASSKVRQAANLWAVVCGAVCVHVCTCLCTQSRHAFPKDTNHRATWHYWDNRTHSRMGNIIQNKDQTELSLVVQWLRIHLPRQKTRVLSLVWELRSHMPWGK